MLPTYLLWRADRRSGVFGLLHLTLLWAVIALSLPGGRATAGDTVVEQYLPEVQQLPPMQYDMLLRNNNLVFVGIASRTDHNSIFSIKVLEIVRQGPNSRKVEKDEILDVQCWNGNLLTDHVYILPVHIWGAGNNPAASQRAPIELRKDYKNDPRFRVFAFVTRDDGSTDPAEFTATLWKLYQSVPGDNFRTGGRLDLLAFAGDKHLDRIDGTHAELMKEVQRLLYEELLGDAEKLKKVEDGSAMEQSQFERELLAVTRIFALAAGLKPGAEIVRLLAISPLTLRALDPLIEKCSDEERAAVAEKLAPVLEKQIADKRVDRQAIQGLYLAVQLKSDACAKLMKAALDEDAQRANALLLSRALVQIQGAAAWPTVSKVFENYQETADNTAVWVHMDLIRQSIEHVGRPAYPALVRGIKKSQRVQQMMYQFFNQLAPAAKEDFGFELLAAEVHNVLPFLLQQQTSINPRLIDYVLRYAVGEISGDNDMENQMLIGICQNARQFLKQQLGAEIGTRAEFNDWYLQRLQTVKLPIPAEQMAKLPDWRRDLASPRATTRQQVQKELHSLGADALPVLLDLEHTAKDLTTRQMARSLILQLPLISEAFAK